MNISSKVCGFGQNGFARITGGMLCEVHLNFDVLWCEILKTTLAYSLFKLYTMSNYIYINSGVSLCNGQK